MMRIIACLSFVLLVSGCGTGQFGSTYRDYVTPRMAENVVLLAEGEEPNLILSNDLDRDVMSYRERNYVVIGESSFNGPREDPQNAIKQAKQVGATEVIISSEFVGVESRIEYDYHDVYSTVFENRVKTVDGLEVNVQEEVTVIDQVSVPHMSQFDNFDQGAVYMVRSNEVHKLGILIRDLSQQERAIYSRTTGTVIEVVLANSPVYLAGIVGGDVLIAINGETIEGTGHAIRIIQALELGGNKVVLSVLKGGNQQDITIEFSGG